MHQFEKWDLWYAMVKFEEDAEQAKERPAIVITVNKEGAVGLYITSSNPRPGYRDYPIRNWKKAGLKIPCTVRLDHTVPLSESVCRRWIGTLDNEDILKISLRLADATLTHR